MFILDCAGALNATHFTACTDVVQLLLWVDSKFRRGDFLMHSFAPPHS